MTTPEPSAEAAEKAFVQFMNVLPNDSKLIQGFIDEMEDLLTAALDDGM